MMKSELIGKEIINLDTLCTCGEFRVVYWGGVRPQHEVPVKYKCISCDKIRKAKTYKQ